VLSRAGLWSVQHPRSTWYLGAIGLHLDYDMACEGSCSSIPALRPNDGHGVRGWSRTRYGRPLNGLKTLSPGRLKSRSFPVAIVSP
jgi:hypothetical protein